MLGEHDDHDHHLPESPGRPNPPEVEEQDIHFDPDAHSSMRAFLLVSALSLHAVFEGLSLGLINQVTVLLQVRLPLLFINNFKISDLWSSGNSQICNWIFSRNQISSIEIEKLHSDAVLRYLCGSSFNWRIFRIGNNPIHE